MHLTQWEIAKSNPDLVDELHALMDAVDENSTKKARRAYRDFLADHPELWSYAGNIVEQAAYNLIGVVAKQNPTLEDSLRKGFTQLPADLRLPTDGPLEELLMQQVVLCWIRYGQVEYFYTSIISEGGTFEKLRYWEQRLNAAQRRYLRALEALARIRKLQLPSIQVNIGRQQVNQVNTG